MNVVPIGLLILILLLVAGRIYQIAGEARDARLFPPRGRLVDVGGHRLHIHSMGQGSPTVVLDSAVAGSTLNWEHIQGEVAQLTRVSSYDRAGFGWSDGGPMPRTTAQIVEELHHLLANAGEKPPYVLVGHSFGGLTARLFAATYPEEVAGMVLVDSTHPDEWLRMAPERKKELQRHAMIARLGAEVTRLGLTRFYFFLIRAGWVKVREDDPVVTFIRRLPGEIRPILRAYWNRPEPYEAVASQVECIRASSLQVAAKDGFGDLPLAVISAPNPDPARMAEQYDLARLSSNSKHIIAALSSHWVQYDEPQLVIETIREMVERARRAR